MDQSASKRPCSGDPPLATQHNVKRLRISNQEGPLAAFDGGGMQNTGPGSINVHGDFIIGSRHPNPPATDYGNNIVPDTHSQIRSELMDLLHFEEIDERILTLRSAHYKTCEWFLDTIEYKDWIDSENFHDHHGFLWIKGKPGAGKSILMKFLDSKAKAAAKSEADDIVVTFFFNARGAELEKSTIGLYRSLLWQLLEKAVHLQDVLNNLDPNAHKVILNRGWQLEIIKEIFFKAIKRLGHRKLKLFIDALDEGADEDVEDMISFFEEIGEWAVENNVSVHICFSSRHYPTINIKWGKYVTLENEEGHANDIARFIKSKLKLNNSKKAESLRSQIQEKSLGLFLWVVLVIDMLNKACAKGQVERFQECLDRIPQGLDDLFEMILRRDSTDIQDLRLGIQWILFAKRPLTLEEYFFAIRNPTCLEATSCLISDNITPEYLYRCVDSSSKGLAEATKNKKKDKVRTVQFIHESVRDFFLVHGGINRLWPDLNCDFAHHSHDLLKDRCLAEVNGSVFNGAIKKALDSLSQISSKISSGAKIDVSELIPADSPPLEYSQKEISDLSLLISKELPLLEYAVHYLLHHANDSEVNTPRYDMFLKEFPLTYWIFLDNIFEKFKIRRHTYRASLLYLLSEKNLPNLISHELKRVPHMDIPGERYFFPMFAACANDNQEAIMALLMQDVKSRAESTLHLQVKSFCKVKPWRDRIPLLIAAEMGHWAIVKLLLETHKANIDRSTLNAVLILIAGKRGHKSIDKLLLETDQVDIEIRTLHEALIFTAAENGHEDSVRALLDTHKVDIDLSTLTKLLFIAANRGHKDIVKVLLFIAAKRGHGSIIKLLIDINQINIEPKDSFQRTPFLYAAKNGHKDIIKLLLDTNQVDIESKDYDGRTPFSYAAGNGHDYIVKLLLNTNQVNIESKDSIQRTPFSYAAGNGHDSIVKLLLDTNRVDVESIDYIRRTPFSYAAENGHDYIVKLLLDTNRVDVDSIDGFGLTPLSFANVKGHQKVVELIRSKIGSQDK